MMWFWVVSHQLLWDNDPPDAPARLKCEEKTFVFVYFTILKIICSSLRQYREPLVTLHPFLFFPAVAKWRQRQKDVFRKHCWDYECNIFRLLSERLLRESHHFKKVWTVVTFPVSTRAELINIYSSLEIRYLREVAATSSPNWKSYDVCVFLSDWPLEQYHSCIYSSSGASAFVSCTFVFHLRVTSGNGPPVSIVI